MKHNQDEITYDNIIIGICLSLLGGFLDSYSYLLKGKVFANAQTGNVVLLFLSLANKEYTRCLKYIVPITTFAFGILFSELLKGNHDIKNGKRLRLVLFVELVLLAIIGVIGKYIHNDIVNSIISFIAAIQVANFDKVDGNSIATTMITGNLKSSMINASKYIHTNNIIYLSSFFKYIVIILSFSIGVVIGFFFIKIYTEKSIFLCEFFIVISFIIIKKEEQIAL